MRETRHGQLHYTGNDNLGVALTFMEQGATCASRVCVAVQRLANSVSSTLSIFACIATPSQNFPEHILTHGAVRRTAPCAPGFCEQGVQLGCDSARNV